jgi:NAD(P)-dependent dehydrogenase (short-subunit alcohol dehydrogenase family)
MVGDNRRFAGKVAIVTGGATGIGRAIAMRLAGEGAMVTVADVNEGFATQTERDIRDAGGHARFVPCDVSQSSDVQAMIDTVIGEHQRIDVLVNNAGIPGPLVPVDELAEDAWERQIRAAGTDEV